MPTAVVPVQVADRQVGTDAFIKMLSRSASISASSWVDSARSKKGSGKLLRSPAHHHLLTSSDGADHTYRNLWASSKITTSKTLLRCQAWAMESGLISKHGVSLVRASGIFDISSRREGGAFFVISVPKDAHSEFATCQSPVWGVQPERARSKSRVSVVSGRQAHGSLECAARVRRFHECANDEP